MSRDQRDERRVAAVLYGSRAGHVTPAPRNVDPTVLCEDCRICRDRNWPPSRRCRLHDPLLGGDVKDAA